MARNSELILCSGIRLDREYSNVVDYSESNMLSLCRTNKIGGDSNYSFIRSESRLVTSIPYGTALQGNYIAFQNPDYSNKWFFAFVDDVKYVNDNSTEIYYTIDQFSTWFRNLSINDCFVVREHTNDDTIGSNTIDENLDVGQIIATWGKTDTNLSTNNGYFWIVVACNFNPNPTESQGAERYAGMAMYGDYPQGSAWFAWLINPNNYTTEILSLSQWIYDVAQRGHSNDIQSIFAVPYQAFNAIGDVGEDHLVKSGGGRKINVQDILSKNIMYTMDAQQLNLKNNKCNVYPYLFLRITNNAGSFNDYKIEDFHFPEADDNISFNYIGIPCLGYSGKVRPQYYQGIDNNEDESLQMGKYPTLSWSSDAFTNWITENAVSIGVSGISAVIGGAVSVATANPIGIASASLSIANIIGQFTQAKMKPNTAEGNANAGDLNLSFNLNRFKIFRMRPKAEYLKRIDDYFSTYGYKTLRMKIPNITGRRYWNYVEIEQNESIGHGSIPADALNTINNAFHQGVTIWHNHSNIGNYELDNSIV